MTGTDVPVQWQVQLSLCSDSYSCPCARHEDVRRTGSAAPLISYPRHCTEQSGKLHARPDYFRRNIESQNPSGHFGQASTFLSGVSNPTSNPRFYSPLGQPGSLCVRACVCARGYVCTYVRTYVCTYVCMYVRMYVCMYVCTYVRMYVRTYVCMYFLKLYIEHAPLLLVVLHAML